MFTSRYADEEGRLRIINMDRLAALPRVRSSNSKDLAAIIVKSMFDDHVVPAVRARTVDEFVSLTESQMSGFEAKILAIVHLPQDGSLRPASREEIDDLSDSEHAEWVLTLQYSHETRRAASRLFSDRRFMDSFTAKSLQDLYQLSMLSSWLLVCGLAAREEGDSVADPVAAFICERGLDIAKRAYHLIRDAELAYSRPNEEEAKAMLLHIRNLRARSAA